MRRFFAKTTPAAGDRIVLGHEETRHLRDVLRLGVGDVVNIFDGKGGEFECVIEEAGRQAATVAVRGRVEPVSPESPISITIAAAILPGEKFEFTVQKAVELGVTRLIPLFTMRCEVKPGRSGRVERWRKIAVEAAKQSGRATLMEIAEPIAFGELLCGTAHAGETKIMLSERDGGAFDLIPAVGSYLLIFGPKGGWDDSELAAARDSGVIAVTLGGRIMRAETAAIAITALVQHRFGDLR